MVTLTSPKETIRAAKRTGADCIKLQTYTADTITLNVKTDMFKAQKGSHWDGQYLHDLYQKAHTPWNGMKNYLSAQKGRNYNIFFSIRFNCRGFIREVKYTGF